MSKKQNDQNTEVSVYVKMSCIAFMWPAKGLLTRDDVAEEVKRMLTNPDSCLWDTIFDDMTVMGVTNYKTDEIISIDLT